jgi:hypothetical protein
MPLHYRAHPYCLPSPERRRHPGSAQTHGDRQLHRAGADGRIHIELINWPFLQEHRGSPAEYKAGLDFASRGAAATLA